MRTSESRVASGPLPARTIALEALAVAALALGVSALLAPADVGMGAHALRPHPIWLAVALMAARYGTRGLAAGLIGGWTLTIGAAAALRVPMAVVEARIGSGPDLGALLGVILIGWVASIHERRARELGMAVAALEECSASDAAALEALRSTAVVLRARADRLDTSLTFLRDVATRLESGESSAAAQAALDLATARLGARLGWVAMSDGERLTPVASTGPWAPLPSPRSDWTVAAALRLRRPSRALDSSATGRLMTVIPRRRSCWGRTGVSSVSSSCAACRRGAPARRRCTTSPSSLVGPRVPSPPAGSRRRCTRPRPQALSTASARSTAMTMTTSTDRPAFPFSSWGPWKRSRILPRRGRRFGGVGRVGCPCRSPRRGRTPAGASPAPSTRIKR